MSKNIIKNKLKFYRFLKENIKHYNKKIRGFYLITLESQAKVTQNGKSNFVIPPIYTKDKKFKMYQYNLNRNKNKLIIEL